MSNLNDFVIRDGVLVEYRGEESDVVIPDSVTSIGERAFYDCVSLTSVKIPDGVMSIGREAFCGCSSLANVVLPWGLTSMVMAEFSDCGPVTTVGESAFTGCSKLADENGLVIVGDCLYDCYSKSSSIEIPDGVKSINRAAFCRCTSLARVVVPESVKRVGWRAFAGVKQVFIKDINLLSGGDKPAAVAGFATCPEDFSPQEVAAYLDCVKEFAPYFAGTALSNMKFLILLLENDCLDPDAIDVYLKLAVKVRNTEATAMLLAAKR